MMERKPDEQNHCKCSRRDFIKNTVTGLGTIAIGSFTVSLLEGCISTDSRMMGTYASVTPRSDRAAIIVDISKTENLALATIGGTLALGGNDVDRNGILLYRESEVTVKAYSRECTHEECTVGPFINGLSSCPCHRSQFDLSGVSISGPAQGALNPYTTSLNGDIITINA